MFFFHRISKHWGVLMFQRKKSFGSVLSKLFLVIPKCKLISNTHLDTKLKFRLFACQLTYTLTWKMQKCFLDFLVATHHFTTLKSTGEGLACPRTLYSPSDLIFCWPSHRLSNWTLSAFACKEMFTYEL